jgi:hypothetical protein
LKHILRAYMGNFPGSFVGFLDTVSDILRELGTEWEGFGFRVQSKQSFAWGKVFVEAADSIAEVAVKLSRIKDEHDAAANPEKV